MSIEAMRQAVEALVQTDTHPISSAEQYFKEMTAMEALEDAIKDAIEQAEQENATPTKMCGPNLEGILNAAGFYRKRGWVGLTYAEISEEADRLNLRDGTLNGAISFANVIAAKLKAKNS
jgi:type VI protein secretion system component VasK